MSHPCRLIQLSFVLLNLILRRLIPRKSRSPALYSLMTSLALILCFQSSLVVAHNLQSSLLDESLFPQKPLQSARSSGMTEPMDRLGLYLSHSLTGHAQFFSDLVKGVSLAI